jgi:acid phosphatase
LPAKGAFRVMTFLPNKLKPQLTFCMKLQKRKSSAGHRLLAAGVTALLASRLAALAQFTTPHLSNIPGAVTNVLGPTVFINRGLVGVGHISASARDTFGETFGSCSSMQITGWKTNGDGSYGGTLNILPDRGYNSGNFYADYAARINQVGFTFKPYYGSTNIGGTTDLDKLNAQTNQISFGPISGVKFTYYDPNTGSNSFTTGLDPGTNSTTLFGKTMPYVTTYIGQQSPSVTNLITYTGIDKLPLDSEALILKPDGSGYVGDEYGANIYYFNSAKVITNAIVPPPAMQPHSPTNVLNYTSATTPVNGRRNNQGFEGVSLSPDGTHLFALQQSACVQDSDFAANNQNAKNTRLLIYDVSTNPVPGSPIAEYALTLPTYKGNGNGNAADKTCAQSEVVALDNQRFLVLPRDGNGLGNNANNPNAYKTVILVDTSVDAPVNFATDAARNAEGGKITTASGVLDPAVTPLSWVEGVNMLNTNQLAKFNVKWDSGAGQVSKLTMGEKWEGMALVSANDPNNPNDYFLFVGNDNDFLTSAGQMRGPDGTIVSYNGFNGYPANRVPAPLDSMNNENDTRILAFRVTIQSTLQQIDHFIVIYQENWSFDALYGSFPGANGIANASGASTNQLDRLTGNLISSLGMTNYDPVSSAIPIQNPPAPLNGTQDIRFLTDTNNLNSPTLVNTLLPYGLEAFLDPTNLTGDIVHRYWQEQHQINHGSNDRFITWSDNPGLVMSHFDASQLPEGKLAQQYTICDNYFHSAFGGSFLNHQFLIAAQAPVYTNAAAIIPNSVALLDSNGVLQLNVPGNGRLTRDGNITPIGGVCFANTNLTFDKNYAVNTIFSVNLAASGSPTATSLLPSQNDSDPSDLTRPYIPNIGDRLDAAGVSWKWYSGGWDRALNVSPSNPAHYGMTVPDSSVALFQWHHQAFAFYDNYAPWTNGLRNARSASHLQDETNFFNDVMSNTLPSVCFIKPLGPDNEHPGYASLLQGQLHVSNIVAAVQANPALWAHTAIIVTYDEHGGRWDHVAPPARDIWGPGSRVPAIIISPFAKHGHVEHTQYDTTAILASIEKRFGVPPLNRLDANSPTFANVFNASVTDPVTPPTLKINPAQYEFAYSETNTDPEDPGYGTVNNKSNLVSAQLSWPGAYLTYTLQANSNSLVNTSAWVNVSSVSNNTITVPVDNMQKNVFYRLIQQ